MPHFNLFNPVVHTFPSGPRTHPELSGATIFGRDRHSRSFVCWPSNLNPEPRVLLLDGPRSQSLSDLHRPLLHNSTAGRWEASKFTSSEEVEGKKTNDLEVRRFCVPAVKWPWAQISWEPVASDNWGFMLNRLTRDESLKFKSFEAWEKQRKDYWPADLPKNQETPEKALGPQILHQGQFQLC